MAVSAIIRRLRLCTMAAAVLLLPACQQQQATTAVLPASAAPDGAYVDPATSLAFPATLGSFRRTEIRVQPKGGISVGYERPSPSQKVSSTVMFYPAPWRDDLLPMPLPGKAFSGLCRPEFERVKQRVTTDHPSARFLDERGFIDAAQNRYAGSTRLLYDESTTGGAPRQNLRVYVTCLGERGWIIRTDLTAPPSVDLEVAYQELRRGLMSASPGVRGYGWDGAPRPD